MFNAGIYHQSTQMAGGFVGGSGTLNYVAKWTPNGVTIGNSQIFDNGTNVGVNTATPSTKFHVNGKFTLQGVSSSDILLDNGGSGNVLRFTDPTETDIVSITLNQGTLTAFKSNQAAFSFDKDVRIDATGVSNIYVNNGGNGLRLSGRNDVSGDYGVTINNDGYVIFQANNAAIADGSLAVSKFAFYIDEAGNTLTVKVKYSGGTVKTGTVALT